MKIKSRKILVFWVINLQLLGLFVLSIFIAPDSLTGIGHTLIFGLIGNGAIYIGGNVADAWQKSKYYRQELDDESKESVTGN
jgi:type IV secretory pathway TrbL component